jgi:hypothetical protein
MPTETTTPDGRFHSFRCPLSCTIDHKAWGEGRLEGDLKTEAGGSFTSALRALDSLLGKGEGR